MNHRRLEQCILDSLNWRCLKKKYAQAAKPNRAHQHKRLIPTVKRGAGGGRSVAAGPGHLSVTEFFVNFSECRKVFQFQNMVIWVKKCQCWSRQQEPMTFPDSFSSTTRGAGATIVPLGTLNSMCGPTGLSTPLSDDVHTFLPIKLDCNLTWTKQASNPHINRQQLWERTTMKTGVATPPT